MKIFITGATGFIAAGLAKKLAAEGNQVHALVRDVSKAGHLKHENIQLFIGDLNDIPSIHRAIAGCEEVYHCAGYARLWAKNRSEFYKVNLEGTNNILQQSVLHNIKKVVFTSSTCVLGQSMGNALTEKDPRIQAFEDDYDLSKLLAEQQVKEYTSKGLFCVIVNPSRVYGPGPFSYSNAISRMLFDALRGKRILVPFAPHCRANYAFVEDVVEGHVLAMKYGACGERYILGGENVTYDEFLEVVTGITGKLCITKLPLPVMKIGGVLELIKANITGCFPAYTPRMLDRYFISTMFSCAKAKTELGYQVTPFKTGIENTINYLKTEML